MPLLRLTLRQIEAFAAVAENASFGAAARQMQLTPSAVSQLVAELEAIAGFRVFDRTTRKVQLSSAGRDFLASAESVLWHARAAESAAADLRHRAAGVVRVGAPLVLASLVLPAAIQAFLADRPKVRVRVVDTSVDALIDRLERGDLDLAVGPDLPGGQALQRVVVFDSPWVLWCAVHHPLARRRTVRWDDLRGIPLVLAGRDHTVSVERMLASAPEEVRISPVDVVDNLSTALGLAAQGLAATLAPDYVAVMAEPMGLVCRRVTDPETIRQVCVYQPGARVATPAAQALAEHLGPWLSQWRVAQAPKGRATRSGRAAQPRHTSAANKG